MSSLAFAQLGSAQPLEAHLWKHRIVLLLAPDAELPALQQQYNLWTAEPEKVTDRDLVLYRLFRESGIGPDGSPLQPELFQALLHKYGPVAADGLKVILIGKDGTIKLEQASVVQMSALFARIDGMPMRRAEMRRKKNQGFEQH